MHTPETSCLYHDYVNSSVIIWFEILLWLSGGENVARPDKRLLNLQTLRAGAYSRWALNRLTQEPITE